MARVARSRSRSFTLRGKRTDYLTSDESTVSGELFYEVVRDSSIQDFHGRPLVASSLTSTQRRGGLFLSGYAISDIGRRTKFDSVPFLDALGDTVPALQVPPDGWMLDLVAGTNPSRPKLTPPTLLQNLYELPRMLRNAVKFFQHPKTILTPKGAANEYLGLKFGWLPFINDIQELLNLQELIDKRQKELKDLYNSEKGIRRRLKFGDDTQVLKRSNTFSLQGSSIVTCPISLTVKRARWATIRWKPTSPPAYHPDDSRFRDQTRRIILGLTPQGLAKGAWDVIPWTWLIGWFTNIGKLTTAFANTIPASHSEACFMCSWSAGAVGQDPTVSFTNRYKLNVSGLATRTVKARYVGGTVVPGFNMPFLDMSRLSVLGALGIQRFKSLKF